MAHSPVVVPSGFFVLRTPLLPLDDFLRWGGAAAAADSAEAADGPGGSWSDAGDDERQRLRDGLALVLDRPEVDEALFVASPSLYDSLLDWRQDPYSARGKRAEAALVRYFARMAARPTPFGLFAGCSLGEVDPDNGPTELSLRARSAYRRHTRLDMLYVGRVVEELAAIVHRRNGRLTSSLVASDRARALHSLCEGARTRAVEGIECDVLTRREREVAALAARGLSNRDIADLLVVSVRTIENQLHRVYGKLGVAGREELATALDSGIAQNVSNDRVGRRDESSSRSTRQAARR